MTINGGGFIKKLNNKNTIFLYIYGIVVFISIITVVFWISSTSLKRERTNYSDFSEGWYSSDDKVDLSKIYKYSEVTKKIPQLEHDTELYLNVKSINIDVYIDDECVYKYINYDKKIFGKTPGTHFIKVNLNKEDSGKNIVLKVDRVYSDNSGKIKEAYIGDASEVILDFVADHMIGSIVAAMIVFIGLVLVIIFIPLKLKRKIGLKMIYLGLFALSIGIYMFTDTKILQWLSGNEHLYHIIAEISMLLIAVPLMLFIDRAYEKSSNSKCIFILCSLGILDFIIRYTLYVLNIFDFHESLKLTHFTYILCLSYILFVCIKSLITGTKKEKNHTLGFVFFCLFALLDIAILYFGTMVETSFFTRIGVLIFLCLEGVQFALEYIKQYNDQSKTELLSRLAYQDGLTELSNRTSFMEDKEKLKSSKTGLIAVFDVNDLKYVNDNFGHAEGDKLIVRVSNALKEHLNDIGKCYRIGGDEFVFITKEDNIEDKFKLMYNQVLIDLDRYKENKYSMSIAMGYKTIDEENDIDKAFEIADNYMYENKMMIKKQRKNNINKNK